MFVGRRTQETSGDTQKQENPNQTEVFSGSNLNCKDVEFSPSSDDIAVLYSDGSISIWRGERQQWLRDDAIRGDGTALCWSPNGSYMAVASADGFLELWALQPQKRLWRHRVHLGRVWSVQFSHDGELIASSGADKTVQMVNTTTGVLQRTLNGHTKEVISCRFSLDDKRLVTSSWDGTARGWYLNSDHLVDSFSVHNGLTWFAEFSLDGSRILSVGSDGTAKLYPSSMKSFMATAFTLIKYQPEYATLEDGVRKFRQQVPEKDDAIAQTRDLSSQRHRRSR